MNDWRRSLPDLLDHAWARLKKGATDRDTVSLATVSPNGWPEVRTVVLRAADPAASTVAVYTDSTSDKMVSLAHNARVALTLWDPDMRLQLRLQGEVDIQTGDAVAHLWSALPPHSLLSYGIVPAPGQVIAGPEAYAKSPDPTVFAVLKLTLVHLDVVQLDEPHRRAAFSRDSEWSGNWLAP